MRAFCTLLDVDAAAAAAHCRRPPSSSSTCSWRCGAPGRGVPARA